MILVAPALLALAACGGGSDKSGPPTSLQPTFVINSGPGAVAPAPSGPQASSNELAGITDGFAKVKSYRATMLIESPGAPAQEGKMEVVAPDKQHLILGGFEMIKIGNDTYVKIGPSWTKTPSTGAGTPGFDVDGVNKSVGNLKTSGAVKGSTASVNGKTCQLYTSTSPTGSSETCIADGLPLRVVSTSGGAKTTITFSDYNANIEIKAPI